MTHQQHSGSWGNRKAWWRRLEPRGRLMKAETFSRSPPRPASARGVLLQTVRQPGMSTRTCHLTPGLVDSVPLVGVPRLLHLQTTPPIAGDWQRPLWDSALKAREKPPGPPAGTSRG